MKNLLRSIFTLFCLGWVSIIYSQSSNLSVQGVLRKANGTAVENGQYDITFKLYLDATSGTPLWEEMIENVDVEGGIYSVVLGSGDTPLNAAFDQPYYLGVAIEGGTELIPRARLTSSPYALSLIGNDNVFPNSGNVGVGAADPQNKLTIARGDGILGLDVDETAGNTAVITTTSVGMSFDAGGTDKDFDFEEGDVKVNNGDLVLDQGDLVLQDGSFVFSNEANTPANVASLEFDIANGNKLILSNTIGDAKIEGENIELNPTSGITLVNGTIQADSDGETLKLVGTDTSFIAFYPEGEGAGRKGFIGFKDGSTDLEIGNEYDDESRIQIYNQVHIAGAKEMSFGPYRYLHYNGVFHVPSTFDIPFNLYTDRIRAVTFYADSDRRIKQDLKISNGSKDLETLKKIEVTDYQHRDVVNLGSDYKKGFIAQQVRTVFPEAVTLTSGEIPNIYEFPETIEIIDRRVKIKVSKPHNLSRGDRVRIISNNINQTYEVSSVMDNYTFSVDDFEGDPKSQEVFVFGKEIHDFHTVDYDRVFTLAVSATQELARKIEALEKDNARLKKENGRQLKSNTALKAEVETISSRLQNIETLLNTTSGN